ncbi:mannonate dehydratase [Haloterrigena salina JCM 13891]|uniref:Mannonate dehydratase n=1 Tax=Haloterrigena salina JCM 13891 TaxID=1227488 RepID=M0CPW7_9EURY|nr:mannonate dehydratase [Haloterrigena salina JCM 13891]
MTTETTIRVGVRTRSLSRPRLQYIRQLGATDVFVDHADVDEEPDEFNDRDANATFAVGRDAIPRSRTSRQRKTASRRPTSPWPGSSRCRTRCTAISCSTATGWTRRSSRSRR